MAWPELVSGPASDAPPGPLTVARPLQVGGADVGELRLHFPEVVPLSPREQMQLSREQVGLLKIRHAETGIEIERVEHPVLRFTAPLWGGHHGTVWIWGKRGRPVALAIQSVLACAVPVIPKTVWVTSPLMSAPNPSPSMPITQLGAS